MAKFESLKDVIVSKSNINDKGVTYISSEEKDKFVSYGQLYVQSLCILKSLQLKGVKPKSELVFQIENPEEFIPIFWACVLGGIIPVPVTVGNNDEARLKLFKICKALNYPNLIIDKGPFAKLEEFALKAQLTRSFENIKENVIFIEDFENEKSYGEICNAELNDIALIQFSSGSTGDPKGVILTHENLLTNSNDLNCRWEVTSNDSCLSWMPLTHDMGLIAVHITSMVAEINQYIMPTTLFVRHPLLWIKKAHEYHISQLYSPNFGYKHFLTFYNDENNEEWDLSSVRIIVNGAEPISVELCNEFIGKMSRYVMKKNVMYPGYGLAEGTVGVCFPRVGEDFVSIKLRRDSLGIGQEIKEVDYDDEGVSFVNVGFPVDNCNIRICDDDNTVLKDNTIGYIEIKGKNVTQGYYNNHQATAKVLSEDGWLNTGDLGFLKDGRLVITGRAKDIIFVNGQNYYPHDIERVAENIDGVELGKIAACGVYNGESHSEDIILFVLFKKKPKDMIPLAIELKKYINRTMGLDIKHVIPVKKMVKTTSGKVQRYKFAEMYKNGKFDQVVDDMQVLLKAEACDEEVKEPLDIIEEGLVQIWKGILKVERVGLDEDFFECGGNSLRASILSSRIRQQFNVEISNIQAFETPTVKGMAEYIRNASQIIHTHIERVKKNSNYSVSSVQKRMFVLHQLEGAGSTYNIPSAYIIEGKLKIEAFRDAIKEIVDRHETLRTSFEFIDGKPVQIVHDNVDFDLSFSCEGQIEVEMLIERFVRPFNLSTCPLIRVELVQLSEERYLFLFDMHHIISDGTSLGIFVKEITMLYQGIKLPELNIQYRDFSAWQNEALKSPYMKKQGAFWVETFKGEIPVLNMPTDYLRHASQSFEGERYDFEIGSHLADSLRSITTQAGATLYMVLLAAYNILLFKYTGQEDIVVGSPVAGRAHADTEQLIGMFVNTLAMRSYPSGSKSFKEFLQEVKEYVLKAIENQDYQFEELVENLNIPRDFGRNPLFDTMFVLQNMELNSIEIADLKIIPKEVNNKTSKFDLFLQAIEKDNGGIVFNLEYCSKLFKGETIERLAGHFVSILEQVAHNIELKLSEIDILNEREKQSVLWDFNTTGVDYAKGMTIHKLFKEQVERTPDDIALTFKDCRLTYSELDKRANKLANYLRREMGVKPDTLIGVFMERSHNMIIAILGVLKAGGAYVPIDTEFPEERIKSIINDARINIVVSSAMQIDLLNRLQWECKDFDKYVCVDTQNVYGVEHVAKNELMDEKLWEFIGSEATNEIGGGGWISSYTGEEFSKPEMEEYADNVFQKLKPYLNKDVKILEIGCATGITMFRIAPFVKMYYGTDLSKIIIERNKQRVEAEGIDNIKLSCLPAHDIDMVDVKDFDIVIINSVVQYFPGVNYLRDIVSKSLSLIKDKGIIYIGDVMDLGLKPKLLQSLLEFKNDNAGSGYKTKTEFDSELFVSREFIEDLKAEFGEIRDIYISNKLHTIENELSMFRYDSIIEVDKTCKNRANGNKHKYQCGSEVIEKHSEELETDAAQPENLAYVIYTSGSTGKPKGVMLEHMSVNNFIKGTTDIIEFMPGKKILALTTISFDIFVLETLLALTKGLNVVVADEEQQHNSRLLGDLIESSGIDMLQVTPSRMMLLMNDDVSLSCLKGVKDIMVGGEAFPKYLLDSIKKLSKAKIYNLYGPTETTVWSTIKDLTYCSEINIGKPIANTQIYILDKNDRPVPVGVAGELCIAGDGLARGYLNMDDLTKEKFVPNPFIPGRLMYRTGDFARWLDDGDVEFIGRIDHQVKIRGFRIELDDIEANLLSYDKVDEAVVVAKEDESGSKYICTYVVAKEEFSIQELKEYLKKELPDYMIPSQFIQLDALPLTASGKIDRKALNNLEGAASSVAEYAAPGNETEEKLLKIWQEVLGTKQIGINDSFFELGGHSITAMHAINKIAGELKIDISLKDFMKQSTIAKMASLILCSELADKKLMYTDKEGDLANIYDPFPLTDVQLAYLMGRDSKYEMGGISTHIYLEIQTKMDVQRLNKSLQKVIERHPMLRAVVSQEGIQTILKEVPLYSVELMDISSLSNDAKDECIRKERNRMSHFVFDTAKWPLFEIKAFRLDDENTYFCLGYDLLIADGASIQIIARELMEFYNNPELELPEIGFTFRDYINAYLEFKNSETYQRDREYWLGKLDSFPMAPELPVVQSPRAISKPHFKRRSKTFKRHCWDKLKRIASKKNITLSALVCTAYAQVLAFWSNQDRFAVNLTVFNRYPFHKDVNRIVGDFTSIMLLDINLHNGTLFWEKAQHLQNTLMEALQHRHYDGVEFIRDLSRYYNLGSRAAMPMVFTSMLSNSEGNDRTDWSDIASIRRGISQTSQVFIDSQAIEINGELIVTWDYVEQLFEEEMIDSMFEQYTSIIEELIENDAEYEISLNKQDRDIIMEYNKTREDIEVSTLHGLFARQAKISPDSKAVIFGDKSITYSELDRRSNQVARYLLNNGVSRKDLIGVLASRDINTIVNVMGILKVGAAYVPINPEHPVERRNYILSNSNCLMMLESSLYSDRHICEFEANNIEENEYPEDVAYVIYTSGSTGKPKGVVVEHRAAANTIIDINRKFSVNGNDRIIGLSSMCFDLSVYDIFGALSTGAALVLVSDQRDANELVSTIENHGITFWNSVPAIMDMVLENMNKSFINFNLRQVLLSGDWIPVTLPEKIKKHFPNASVISLGGATEASIWSIYYPITTVKDSWKSIPYGMPLANQEFYVLNYELKLCPINVQGELFIGGVGLAAKYLNDEEKTKNSFILHHELGRLYRTGDYGVMRKEGYIEFLGRKDYQVKIRGYRIELGEIEASILKIEGIENAAVVDRMDSCGRKYLCAYIVSDNIIKVSDIRESLAVQLPDYMVPAYFVQIDEIPLTSNGKVNRKELPEPELTGDDSEEFELPNNETEEKLVQIWKQILKVDRIGIKDNFFELGGNSLQAQQLVNAIYKSMKARISVRHVFTNSTIEKISKHVMEELEIINASETFGDLNKGDEVFFWSPVAQWEKCDDGIRIENRTYQGLIKDDFPEFYFAAQKGISVSRLIELFPHIDSEILNRYFNDLVRNRVLVSSILRPQEVFSTQSGLFKNTYGEAILYDSGEYYKFKNKQWGRTFEGCTRAEISLSSARKFPDYISERKTYRKFNEETSISFDLFSQLLTVFAQNKTGDKTRYYYASAGGLYPIDIFVYIKENRVENIKQGLYYFNPLKCSLALVNDKDAVTSEAYFFKNKDIFNSSAFSIFMFYNPEVNMPIYGANGYYYACIDTGIMVGALTQVAELSGLGLCSIGDMNFDVIESFFNLGNNRVLLHTVEGGLKAEVVDEDYQEIIQNSSSETKVEASVVSMEDSCMDDFDDSIQGIYESKEGDKVNMYKPFPLTDIQYAYLIGRDNSFEMGNISAHSYLEIETELDLELLSRSLIKVIDRNPMMRAVILPGGMQQILEKVEPYKIEVEDISNLNAKEREQRIIEERGRMAQHVFDAGKWPLFEFRAMKLQENKSRIFVSFDLLIGDGASLQLIVKELIHNYYKPGDTLPELDFTFRDYIYALREFKESETYEKDREYWLSKLESFPASPALCIKMDPSLVKQPNFKRCTKFFDRESWRKLKEAARRNHVTQSALLCTSYAQVLAYWSNQPHMAIDLTVFNRYPFHKDVNNIIGDFTSLIILDVDLSIGASFWDKVRNVQDVISLSLEHKHFDGVQFIRELSRYNSLGTKVVAPIVFTSLLFNYADEEIIDLSQLGEIKSGLSQTPQVFLDNQVMELNGGLSVTWDYVEELFDEKVISLMFEQYTGILSGLIENEDEYEFKLIESERLSVVKYNNTQEYIQPRMLHQLFEDMAGLYPENIAVISGEGSLTYRELNERSSKVACCLNNAGIGRGDMVGVLGQRCADTIVNIMGILKAGAAYVPIEPSYPEDRRNYIKENSGFKIMLEPDFYIKEKGMNYSEKYDARTCDIEDIAYVIYTSGSTGRPKGVVITHKAVSNTIIDINEKFNVGKDDKIIGVSSMCFDLSVYDIFGALSTGSTLIMVPDQRDIENLAKVVQEQDITFWNSVPAIMDMMLEYVDDSYVNRSMKNVLLSGDWIPLKLPEKIMKHFPNAQIISLGGATEVSIWSIYYIIRGVKDGWKSIPYGIPLANQKIYILNYEQNICPIGVQGEIHIGGEGLAVGYLSDSEKTANAFIDHPVLGRLYRTGDYGVMRLDEDVEAGVHVEFLGRKDHQVKIRGYRIELGEIENCILRYGGIKSAAVIDYTETKGKKSLCAYIVSDENIEDSGLRRHLAGSLPEYMIPSYFIHLDSIPLTSNGKVDRKTLPIPGDSADLVEYEAPRNEVEEKLSDIWKEVLGVERVGINDNFFELAGDSIKAIQISAKAQKHQLQIKTQDIFVYNTIAELSGHIKHSEVKCDQGIVTGDTDLSPVQKWFFENYLEVMNHWNQTFMLFNKKGFSQDAVYRVIKKLVEHHDALRMKFTMGESIQGFNRGIEDKLFILEIIDLTVETDYKDTMNDRVMRLQKSIEITGGPMFAAGILRTTDGDYLLMTAHHLVVDGISWRILIEDFETGYRQALQNEEVKFSDKSTSYKQWTKELLNYANSSKMIEELEYWKSIDESDTQLLVNSSKTYENKLKDSDMVSMSLSVEETGQLLKNVNKAYNLEVNDLLLAALGISVKEWAGIERIAISMEGHGREEIISDVDIFRTVGWFTSMYPVVLDMKKSEDLSYILKFVKETIRRIPNKGVGYGILKYLTPHQTKQGLSFKLKPEIGFNYLGQFNDSSETNEFSAWPIFDETCMSRESKRLFALEVVGMTVKNEMTLSFTFNKNQFDKVSISRLAEIYKKSLLALIKHCISVDKTELTPSDMEYSDLSIEELANLEDLLNQ